MLDMDTPTDVVQKDKPPVFADQFQLIKNLKSNPDLGFYYMIYAVDRSSKYFHPYALK